MPGVFQTGPEKAIEEPLFMPYVVTDACIKDFACVTDCVAAAIAPAAEDAEAASVSQVFINPDDCIECGSCAAVCPQGAIFLAEELPADKTEFAAKNAAHFQK
jgi:NAD-dependent dihydropyrimidine dehydrogenase PreA subunit